MHIIQVVFVFDLSWHSELGSNVQTQRDKFYMSYKLWRKWLCILAGFNFFWQPKRNKQKAGNTHFGSYT